MVLTLYHDAISQPCRAVFLFLKTFGIEFKSVELDLFKGEHKAEAILQKNPNGTLPFIDDDGYILTESVAIMRYIANTNKKQVKQHWFPQTDDPKLQAKFDEFLFWQSSGIRKHVIDVFVPLFMDRSATGNESVKKAKDDLTKSIKYLEEHFLKGKDFIAGNEISVADVMGMSELYQLTGVLQEGVYTSNAKVTAWMKRVETKLAPAHFEEAFKKIKGVRRQVQQTK